MKNAVGKNNEAHDVNFVYIRSQGKIKKNMTFNASGVLQLVKGKQANIFKGICDIIGK